MAQLKCSRANFRLWSKRFQKTFTDDAEIGSAYMAAWHEGAQQMLEFLQAEAAEGTDPLRNIGDYGYLQDHIVMVDKDHIVKVDEGIYEDLNATDPDKAVIFVPAEFPSGKIE